MAYIVVAYLQPQLLRFPTKNVGVAHPSSTLLSLVHPACAPTLASMYCSNEHACTPAHAHTRTAATSTPANRTAFNTRAPPARCANISLHAQKPMRDHVRGKADSAR